MGTEKLPLIDTPFRLPPPVLNVSAPEFTVPPVIVPLFRVKTPPPLGALNEAPTLLRAPVMFKVPPTPLIVPPPSRLAVVKFPPKLMVPELVTSNVPART